TAAIATPYSADTDCDGAGDPSAPLAGFTCTVPPGYVANSADGCPADPNKVAPGACGCGNADVDTDEDGTLDCFDGCPNDPEKVAPGACGCGVTDDDQDLDGTPDCVDGCPNDPDKVAAGTCGCGNPEPGASCDDGDPNTGNDVITAGCVCQGQVIDCLDEIGGTALPGTACDDGDPLTFGDIWTNDCDCVGGPVDCNDGDPCTLDSFNGTTCVHAPAMDSDSDGTCDLLDECPNDPNKTEAGTCGCGVVDVDTDGDGTADCIDGCPNDPNKVNPGQCGCGAVETDTDGDSFADCIDACPNDPLKIAPGACGCGVPETDSDGDGTADCVDGCPNDPNKIAPGVCGCGTPDTDSDNDSTPDCNDGCPNDPNKLAPGQCGCGVADTDTDGDGISDCNDSCPNVAGVVGTTCDDGDPNTINDVLTAGCTCAGTPAPVCEGNNLAVIMTTDANGEQTSWEIVPQAGGTPLCTGSGLPSNTTITTPCCVPDGCYQLHVFDSFGDGMTTGGYVLRDGNNDRIIDNAGDGVFGSVSQIANGNGFCLPTGTDHMMASSCDQMELTNASVLRCEPNPAVMAQWLVGNLNDDGYEFHIFDPDGTYSRKITITNANPNTGGPIGPTRSSYLKISSMVTLPVPQFRLLNIRVRSIVNGVVANYGPVCRMKIDPSNACQTTQLTTMATSTTQVSCGATNLTVPGSKLYANEVPGATTYLFQFVAPGYLRYITSTSRVLTLNRWYTLPLSCGTTYEVRVRASLDNGLSYCPFGATCQVSTAPCARPEGRVAMIGITEADLKLWPNPNNGEQLYVTVSGLDATLTTVTLDVMDLTGQRVMGTTVPVADGALNTTLRLEDRMSSGIYLLRVTAGEASFTQRLVVQK
ncbi:MAG: T9SS type A sorting domain-containing protein, partial [Bacteroidetes bacterium]|nr:T9SS type A sorting domain-containing protein [Bacteroidota bacterium]